MSFGYMLTIFSLVISVVSLYFLARSAGGNKFSRITSQRLFYLSGISVLFAVIFLFAAFLANNFQYTYVYNYSSKALPLIYIISGFWAGQEGTFLLWIFLLYIFGVIIIRSNDENESIIISIITITQIFLLIIIAIPDYSPFRYIWNTFPDHFKPGQMPLDGAGLNPLLQNPWMIIHPPVLFIGYASATVPFAYAIAGLIKNDYTSWLDRSYKWVLFCMTSLGIGIFLGAYWAYTVLGWGGYWGWDPVENSSLIPWIVIVALMHGMLLQKRKSALVKTNIFLAIISFVLVFYSTFLTRSGVLSDFSVHSFSDLGLSGPLIFFMLFFIVIGLSLFIKRIKKMNSAPLGENIFSFDNMIAFGIISLCFYSFFILIGTSMPILSKIFLPKPTAVETTFYNNLSIPFGILIIVFISLSTMYLKSKKGSRIVFGLMIALSLVLGVFFNLLHTKNIFAYIFAVLAIFLIVLGIYDLIKLQSITVLSSRLSHIGLGILILGIITSNLHSTSIQKALSQGKEEIIRNVSLTFKGLKESKKSSLEFIIKTGADSVKVETPYYMDKITNSLYREPYIKYGFFQDVYISPVNYKSGVLGISKHLLPRGVIKVISGMEVGFSGFDVKKMDMMKGEGVISAKINLRINGRDYRILPGLMIKRGKVLKSIDTVIPGTKRKISVMNIDVKSQEVLIHIEPAKDDVVPPDAAIVEVSFKRLIWLVWLGTIFIAAGGFVAMRRSRNRI